MDINDLAKKYSLKDEDFWELQRKNKQGQLFTVAWIIKHDAVEKIAAIEGIDLVEIKVVNSERDFARFLVTMRKGEKTVSTIGEAVPSNCKTDFFGCMAEKRGIDRAVLKLIDAYQYGIFSDSESDDFKKDDTSINHDVEMLGKIKTRAKLELLLKYKEFDNEKFWAVFKDEDHLFNDVYLMNKAIQGLMSKPDKVISNG